MANKFTCMHPGRSRGATSLYCDWPIVAVITCGPGGAGGEGPPIAGRISGSASVDVVGPDSAPSSKFLTASALGEYHVQLSFLH